jgi:hypothetical protein
MSGFYRRREVLGNQNTEYVFREDRGPRFALESIRTPKTTFLMAGRL